MTSATPADRVPLSAPLYGATIGQAVARFFQKYATFSGRASRSEYWWWFLVNFVISGVLYGFAYTFGSVGATYTENGVSWGPAYWIFTWLATAWGIAVLIPNLALTWRRLHDTNRSGGWFFLVLIPFVGPIILLILVLLPSDPAGIRFDRFDR
jgi:uncharacterized membrane protein YhaH (DUF805 family)